MNNRRELLVVIGGMVAAGCTGTDEQDPELSGGESTESTQMPSPRNGKLRVSKNVTDSSYTYIEETDKVKYVSGYRSGDSPGEEEKVYDTISFTTWAKAEAEEVAASKLHDYLSSKTDISSTEISITGEDSTLTVHRVTRINQDDEVFLTPSIGAEDLADVLPKKLKVIVSLEDKSYETQYIVKISNTTISEGS